MSAQPTTRRRPGLARGAPGRSAALQPSRGGTRHLRPEPPALRRCETCGATFATDDAVLAHLVDAYHGFACLRCGALFPCAAQLADHLRHERHRGRVEPAAMWSTDRIC